MTQEQLWNPALHEHKSVTILMWMTLYSMTPPPAYSHTSPADSTERMGMEEYISTMTDMLMSIGIDKSSAQRSVSKFPKKSDATSVEVYVRGAICP